MKKTLQGYKYRPGTVCISTALRTIIEYSSGQKFDEDLIYGLSSGLFFGFTKTSKFTGIAGLAGELIPDNFCANMTVKKICEEGESDDWEQIKYFIDNNLPVIVESSIDGISLTQQNNPMQSTNEILVRELNLPMSTHWIVVVGYDDEKDTITYADHRVHLEVSRELFNAHRPEKKQRIYFLLPLEFSYLDERIYSSIHKVTDYWLRMPDHPRILADRYTSRLLHIDSVHNTLSGLEQFREYFMQDEVFSDPVYLDMTSFFLVEYTSRSSGGDMTRGIYSRFLKQGYQITGDDRILEAAKLYGNLAHDWRNFFKWFAKNRFNLGQLLQDKESFVHIKNMIHSLVDKEYEAIHYLDSIR